MSALFDLDLPFDDDYRHFHAPYLTAEQDDADAALIAECLQLAAGDTVLDVACGHGRIANRLAAIGCRVTGLDRSAGFLDHARGDAAARGVAPLWLEADMRRLSLVEEFDAALMWFTSFGYFDDATNRDVLLRLRRALRPGGRVLVETSNLFHAALDQQAWQVRQIGGDLMIDHSQYDPVSGRQCVERTIQRQGMPQRRFGFAVRLFSPPELIGWLEQVGFADVEALGGDGEPFQIDSDRLILVARRPG